MSTRAFHERAEPWGWWAAVDFTAPRLAIRREDVVRRVLEEIVRAIGMEPHGEPLVEWFGEAGTEKEGWTAVQLITTSHVAGHFCAHTGRCFVDVFSCRDFDARGVLEGVREVLGEVEETVMFHEERY